MESSRKLPDAYNVKTYGPGRDYTSLAAWESDTDIDLVAAGKGEVLEVDAGEYDDSVTLSGATSSSAYFRVLRAAPGAENFARKTAGARFSSAVSTILVNVEEDNARIHDLGFSLGNRNDTLWCFGIRLYGDNTFGVGCFYYDGHNAGTGSIQGFYLKNDGGVSHLVNCVVENADRGIYVDDIDAGNNGYAYNCTCVDCLIGCYVYRGTLEAKNVLIQRSTQQDYVIGSTGVLSQTTCEIGSAVLFGQDGIRLSPQDTVARDQGTDLSTDPVYPFEDDMRGRVRIRLWDIGAFELDHSVSHPKPFMRKPWGRNPWGRAKFGR